MLINLIISLHLVPILGLTLMTKVISVSLLLVIFLLQDMLSLMKNAFHTVLILLVIAMTIAKSSLSLFRLKLFHIVIHLLYLWFNIFQTKISHWYMFYLLCLYHLLLQIFIPHCHFLHPLVLHQLLYLLLLLLLIHIKWLQEPRHVFTSQELRLLNLIQDKHLMLLKHCPIRIGKELSVMSFLHLNRRKHRDWLNLLLAKQ